MAKAEREILAAGAVVLRHSEQGTEVLVVHRPGYRDWTLPKGKLDDGEPAAVCAVREVREETGVSIRLGRPVGSVRYPVPHGSKTVHWWVGHVVGEKPRRPNSEVDEVRWVPVHEAASLLTYPDEHETLERAAAMPLGGTMLVVRHAKALPRKSFKGESDAARPLSPRGQRQAQQLVQLLGAYGVNELVSSTSVRCVDTLVPYATATRHTVRKVDLLSEEKGEVSPKLVRSYLKRLTAHAMERPHKPIAVCGHRPVLPDMFVGMGVEARPLAPAEVVVVHLDPLGGPAEVEDHLCRG